MKTRNGDLSLSGKTEKQGCSMQNKKKLEKEKKDLDRKIKIITWLLPRFHKGISNPSDYPELVGETYDYENTKKETS